MATRGELKRKKELSARRAADKARDAKPAPKARDNSTQTILQTGKRPADPGPPPKRAELKPKAKSSTKSTPRSKSSNSDLKSWAAKEQAKLQADQAARKKTSSKKAASKPKTSSPRKKSGADKSRSLWLGH
jgi:hypothetical protein